MKLSLNVEADSINVLALNMGQIVEDIDGIELARNDVRNLRHLQLKHQARTD